ncbi:MAG: YncE family protein, partial [Nitrososphaerales archaeon]
LLYVANSNSNYVSVIDTKSNSVVDDIPVGSHPSKVAVNPDTNMVYTLSTASNSTSIIDGSTNSVRTTLPVANPYELAVNRNTNMVYVSNYKSDIVFVINTSVDRPWLLSPYVVGIIIICVLTIAAAGGAVVYVLLRKKKSKMLGVSILFVILQDLKVFSSPRYLAEDKASSSCRGQFLI